jgi:hypothetical protein
MGQENPPRHDSPLHEEVVDEALEIFNACLEKIRRHPLAVALAVAILVALLNGYISFGEFVSGLENIVEKVLTGEFAFN